VRIASTTALVLAAALAACACPSEEPDAAPRIRIDAERYRVGLLPDDYALGGDTPLVTIVVFTDYACPPCGRTWQVLENLVEDYGQDIRVVFRSYTVPGFGKGEEAAEAAFAAGAQGKFWEMHRRLFEHAGAFDRPTLRAHAKAIGLDVPKFMDDLDTGVHAGPRMRHRREAKRLGVVGLPAMFVNGLYLAGFAEEATWHGIVDEEIVRAKELIAAGTRREQIYDTLMASASTKSVAPPKGAAELREELENKRKALDPATAVIAPRGDQRYRIEPGPAPAIGAENAAVLVVEWTDFQCPYCKRAWNEELRALVDARKGEVRFAVRHLPLEIHPAARGAAQAAMAAARQGKFWEYHDLLLQQELASSRDVFVELAAALALDVEKFKADLDDPALAREIDEDIKVAVAVGVDATPAFFVNGRYVSGFEPGRLSAMIDEELAAGKERTKAGVARKDVVPEIMAAAVQPEEFPNR
jgi:protein-disulfide isomerase